MAASNPTALVTGASVGIGLELARLLAADRYKLILVSRDSARLEAVAVELRKLGSPDVRVMPGDLSQPDACEKIAAELAENRTEVDVLINNAGFGLQGEFWKLDLKKQLDLLHVNIVALTHLTYLLLPGMIDRRRGRIMNLASVAAFIPGPLMALYFASKAYVLNYSLALSEECRGTGVTVTTICPGPTRTEFFTRAGILDADIGSAHMMTAESVAKIGYRAMLRGKPLSVTGSTNKLLTMATRVLPRTTVARLVGKRNRMRNK